MFKHSLRRELLAPAFRRVPIGFKLLDGAIDPTNPAIVQMDIRDSRRFGEYVRVWPGAGENELEVLGVDRERRQLVLRVKEARRAFTQVVWRRRDETIEEAQVRFGDPADVRVVEPRQSGWLVEMWTPAEERRFLCGKDDVRLFIAQVRGQVATVEEAHRTLRPARVPEGAPRQGEWFFVAPTVEERAVFDQFLRERPRAVLQRRPIATSGRPHVAELLVKIDRRVKLFGRTRGEDWTFARGTIAHVGHNTMHLDGWHRVVRNTEVLRQNDRLRLRWID